MKLILINLTILIALELKLTLIDLTILIALINFNNLMIGMMIWLKLTLLI